MTKQEKEQLKRLEDKMDNIQNMLAGLSSKLDQHINFIDKTYDNLRRPLELAKRFFK